MTSGTFTAGACNARSPESDEFLHSSREEVLFGSFRLHLLPVCTESTLPLLDCTVLRLLLPESAMLALPGSERHSFRFLSHSCSSSHQDCSSDLPAMKSKLGCSYMHSWPFRSTIMKSSCDDPLKWHILPGFRIIGLPSSTCSTSQQKRFHLPFRYFLSLGCFRSRSQSKNSARAEVSCSTSVSPSSAALQHRSIVNHSCLSVMGGVLLQLRMLHQFVEISPGIPMLQEHPRQCGILEAAAMHHAGLIFPALFLALPAGTTCNQQRSQHVI